VGHDDGYLINSTSAGPTKRAAAAPRAQPSAPAALHRRNIQSDPELRPCERSDASWLRLFDRASPDRGGQTSGRTQPYSRTPSSFDTQEMELLNETDNDLAMALPPYETATSFGARRRRCVKANRSIAKLVQHANSIILHWDARRADLFLNEFGQRFFGYSEAEICGRHVMGTLVRKR